MQQFLPEGYSPQRCQSWTLDSLQQIAAAGDIIQATALYCDSAHDIHVDLFPYEGVIPYAEASLAGREGSMHEKELSQLVGIPICFRVIGRLPDGRWLLSRAEAQRQAQAWLAGTLSVGDVIPAKVTGIAAFGVFCDIGCGLTALLNIENISVARISHPRERMRIGQKLFVAIAAIDLQSGRVSLSHKELLGTWRENAARFLPGQTVRGIVRGIKSYGVFVELAPNLSGLAETTAGYHPGDSVSVFIKSILPQRRKIKLTILDRLNGSIAPAAFRYYITAGNAAGWQYTTS